jgi:GNAT superfamily N-acetyltransferase
MPGSVEHLVWRFPRAIAAGGPPAGVELRPWTAGDPAPLERLAAAAAVGWPRRAGPSAAGWAREFESRPGRAVRAWLTLVAAAGQAGERHAIGWLVVDPAARRRGIGRALAAAALDAARRQGAAEVWVETAATWPEAAAFWRGLGFEPG